MRRHRGRKTRDRKKKEQANERKPPEDRNPALESVSDLRSLQEMSNENLRC